MQKMDGRGIRQEVRIIRKLLQQCLQKMAGTCTEQKQKIKGQKGGC